MKSGYVLGWFTPMGEDRVKEGNYIRIGTNYAPEVQREFATVEFGSGENFKISLVLVSAGGEGEGRLSVALVLLLFRVEIDSRKEYDEYAFVQCMECTDVQDEADDVLNCVCRRWSIDDEAGYNLTGDTGGKNLKQRRVGEWLGVEQLFTIKACVLVMRGEATGKPPLRRRFAGLSFGFT